MRNLRPYIGIALACVGLWLWLQTRPVSNGELLAEKITIEKGTSVSSIATMLYEHGLIRSPLAFKLYAKYLGAQGKMKAGTLSLKPSQNLHEIVNALMSPKQEFLSVTIPEGLTVSDIDALMAKKGFGKPGDILHCAFTCDFETYTFLSKNKGEEKDGIGSRLEGYLFPETYFVPTNEYAPKFFLERMLNTFRNRVVDSHGVAMRSQNHSLAELVIMASLIEKESRHENERAMVSGILWKRLENGVALGVDAAVRYGIQKVREPLTLADLQKDTPYNVRKKHGLPPTPIANPSESSFVAALQPQTSQYWYYLHDTEGKIHYAVDNDGHNENKAMYLH